MTGIRNEETRALANEIRTGFQLVRLMTSLFPLAVAGGLEPPTTGLTTPRLSRDIRGYLLSSACYLDISETCLLDAR